MSTLEEGAKAPDFRMPTDGGGEIALSDLKGKKVVLYFYPKDSTPGCTKEAIAFKDEKARFDQAGAVIVGVSKDPVAAHDKFKAKHELPFTLASDAETTVCEDYGVWKEKNMYGRKFMGIERSTFLIDENGVVRKIWRKVKVANHADSVLEALGEL